MAGGCRRRCLWCWAKGVYSQNYSLIEVGPSTSVLQVGVAWHRAGKLLIHLIRIFNLFLYNFSVLLAEQFRKRGIYRGLLLFQEFSPSPSELNKKKMYLCIPPGTGRGREAHFREATIITGRTFLLFTLLVLRPGKTQLDRTFFFFFFLTLCGGLQFNLFLMSQSGICCRYTMMGF